MTEYISDGDSFYKDLIDKLPVGVVNIDDTGAVLFFSKKGKELLMLKENEGEGEPVLNFISEEYHPIFFSRFDKFRDGLQQGAQVYLLKRKNGTTFFAETHTINQFHTDNNKFILTVTFQDITERRLIEDSLINNENRFGAIFENAGIPMAVSDRNGKPFLVNQAFIDMIGYSREELLKMTYKDFGHPDDFARDNELYSKLMRGELDRYRIEKRYVCKDGRVVWGWLTASLVRDSLGKPIYSVRMVEDITEKIIAENKLKEKETFYRTLFENANDAIFILEDGAVIDCNTKALEMFRSSKENFLGKKPHEFSPEHQPGGIISSLIAEERLKKVIDGESQFFEWRHVDFDGKEFDAEISLTSFKVKESRFILSIVRDITQRKRAERLISESEQKFRTLVDNMHDGLIVRDTSGSIIYFNERILSIFKISADEFNRFSADNYLSRETIERIKELRDSIISGEINSGQIEFEARNRLGENIWLEVRIFPVKDSNNTTVAYQSLTRDITGRKKSEMAIIENEKNYRALFDNLITGFVVSELFYENGKPSYFKYLFVNAAYEKITGLPASYAIGKTSNEIESIDNLFWLHTFDEIIKTGKPQTFDRFLPELKRYFHFGLYTPGPNQIAAFFTDITEQKIAQEALEASESRFRSYFELPLIGIAVLDPDLKWVDGNEKTADIFGYPIEEIKRMTYLDLIHPDDQLPAGDHEKLIKGEIEQYTIVRRFIKKNRTVVYAQIAMGCVRNPDSSIKYFISLIEDITEKTLLMEELESHRKHLEKLVEARTKELEKVNELLQKEIIKQKEAEEKVVAALEKEKELSELKSRFISSASHEFRTPLTTIYSSTQLLERYGRQWKDEMYFAQIGRIKEYIKHLTSIMDDVLIIGRTETGKIVYEPSRIDLKEFCDKIADDVKSLLSPSHRFDYKNSIKKKERKADEKLLKFILLNLLTNAIKYSPTGGKVEFYIKEKNGMVVFEISDEGIGIAEADQPFIFEPFHRGQNVGDIHGTGLGMSIIKRSVELHGGNIEFSSTLNKGSKFTVSLPMEE